jgi:hypothetical protein
MDMEINPTVREAGYEVPPDCVWPDQIGAQAGLSWEEYFTLNTAFEQQKKEEEPSPPDDEDGLPQSGGTPSSDSKASGDDSGSSGEPQPDSGAGETDSQDGSGDSQNSDSGSGDSKPGPGDSGSGGPESGSSGPEADSGSNQAQTPGPDGQAGSSGPQKPGGGSRVEPGVHAPGSLTAEYAPELLGGDFETPEELAAEVQQQVNDFEPKSRIFDPEQRVVPHQAGSGKGGEKLGKANELINVSPDCRWQEVVIDMIASRAAGETVVDWSRPSRRSQSSKFYQPSRRRVSGYKLALILDVSGSCVEFFDAWQAMAREMVEHVREITELEILYHDTDVTNQENWQRRSGEEVTIESDGGGGTDFRPVMKLAESLDVDGAVLFTDSEGPFPSSFCLDCVTVQPPGSYVQTPFGTTIRLTKWE